MKLLLEEAIKRAGGDIPFFNAAYYWKFQKQVDLQGDILAWRVQQQIPVYVTDYLRFCYDLPKS